MQCIIIDDDPVSVTLLKKFVEQTPSLKLAGIYNDSVEAAGALEASTVDFILLDIEMPKMSGYELLSSLTNPPEVILVTSSNEYAAKAFDVNASDYLVKPISYNRFLQAITKVKENILNSEPHLVNENEMFIKVDSKYIKVNFSDIYYIEASSDYISIVTTKGNYTVYSTMKGVQEKLPAGTFLRVHRSYIVNKRMIDEIDSLSLIVNKKAIPIGGVYKEELFKKINFL